MMWTRMKGGVTRVVLLGCLGAATIAGCTATVGKATPTSRSTHHGGELISSAVHWPALVQFLPDGTLRGPVRGQGSSEVIAFTSKVSRLDIVFWCIGPGTGAPALVVDARAPVMMARCSPNNVEAESPVFVRLGSTVIVRVHAARSAHWEVAVGAAAS